MGNKIFTFLKNKWTKMSPKGRKWVLIIGGFLLLAFIGSLLPKEETTQTTVVDFD